MRWVVELPAPSGGTAATVTVESDSWAGALSSARGGVSIRKFRCEFESEGVVRVHDLEANERYTVRPYRASSAPPATESTPAPAPAEAAPAPLRSATVPPVSGRPSRAPQAPGGSFSVPPPPGTSVALPPRSSTPPISSVAADPTAEIEVPSSLSGTVMGMFAAPVIEKAPEPAAVPTVEKAPEPAAAPVVAKAPEPAVAPAAEKAPEPVVVEKPVEAVPAPVVEAAPAPAAAMVVETPEPAKPAVVEDLSATTVDRPAFVAPVAAPVASPDAPAPAVEATPAPAAPLNGAVSDPPMVATTVLFERDQDPGPTNPLTYRERVLCVAEGTSVIEAEAVARQSMTTLKRALATRPRGRYVNVAVFDHAFSHRPSRPPLVVLRWKDWRGDLPEMQIKPALPPPPAPTPAPAAAPAINGSATAGPSTVDIAPAVEPQPEAPKPVETPAPVVAEPAAAVAPVVASPTAPEATVVAEAPAASTAPEAVVAEAPTEKPAVQAPVTADAAAVAPVVAETPAPATIEAESTAASTPAAAEPPAATEPAAAAPAETPAPVEALPAPAGTEPAEAAAASEPAAEPVAVAAVTSTAEVVAVPAAASVAEAPASTPPPAEPAPVVAPAPDRKRFAGGRRGPDLLSDLFDGLMELSFLKDHADICAFVSGVLTQHLRSDAVLVFTYDINRDEFVVHGEANTGRLDQRVRASAGSYGVAVRSKRALGVAHARGGDLSDAACDGGAALFAPGLFRDRLFALVQVARLPGAPAFESDEIDAVSYVAGQLAEALASHSQRQAVTDLAEKRDKRDARR